MNSAFRRAQPVLSVIEEWEIGPTPDYGRHSGTRIANLRNRGLLQEHQIVWGMDLVAYTPTNNPRHSTEGRQP